MYTFETLNDKDLELIARDLLTKKIGVYFQAFKSGSDQGIDLRFSSINSENEIVIQVKHFIGSGFNQLKSKLKNEEYQKIAFLNPKRYILVTSLALSPQNKEALKGDLNPFILSTNDVLGKDDLNNLIRDYPEIEKKHFKLWLSSTSIITQILKNGIIGRSEFTAEKIQERIKLFVPNKTHKDAINILNEHHFLLITGAPGIGKTMLANMLVYQLLAEDFELIYINNDIQEAEDLFNETKKQIFYFDDFLGSNYFDLTISRNYDSAIIHFIERIKTTKDKRLILTSRTTILNHAKETSEKINNSKIEIAKYEVKIEDYSSLDKAKILYNHIYFSNLNAELRLAFFKNKFYWQIIKHRNYNPRIIEFFTDIERIDATEISIYQEQIIDFLDNPALIWNKAFCNQISDSARILLVSLFSIGRAFSNEEEMVKEIFNNRIDYEIEQNGFKRSSNLFSQTVKELLGGFITRTRKVNLQKFDVTEYSFFNPSIIDFLIWYFTNENKEEILSIVKSATYIEQFSSRFSAIEEKFIKKVIISGSLYKEFLKIFLSRCMRLKSNSIANYELIVIKSAFQIFIYKDIKAFIINLFTDSLIEKLTWFDFDNLIEVLSYISDNNVLIDFSFSIDKALLGLSEGLFSYNDIEKLGNFLKECPDYGKVIKQNKESNTDIFIAYKQNIDNKWEEQYDKFINETDSLSSIKNKSDLIDAINDRVDEAKSINGNLFISPSPIIHSYQINYDDMTDKIIHKEQESSENRIKNFSNPSKYVNEEAEIDDLFNIEPFKF